MEKTLYPTHPVHCIITEPIKCGKSVFLTNLILKIINEFEKKVHLLSKSTSRLISEIN